MDVVRQLEIPVFGLGSGGAGAQEVERELAATDGVLRASVSRANATAVIDYDAGETDAWTLARAIERAGYRAGQPVEV